MARDKVGVAFGLDFLESGFGFGCDSDGFFLRWGFFWERYIHILGCQWCWS